MTIKTDGVATPTYQGPCGRAWRLELEDDRKLAGLSVWLLDIPGAHPFWQSYLLSLIHLRPMAGLRDAYKEIPTATHEIMLHAMDPARDHELDGVHFPEKPALLSPANLVEQFELPSDDMARRLVELLARAMIDGMLSPDTDYRAAQCEVIQTTAQHFRDGKHAFA